MKQAVIVLPTYNEAENVGAIIPSIFSVVKDIPNWEVHILVVDATSPDGTADVIRDLQKKYSDLHLLVKEKGGLGADYRKGFEYATEELKAYVIFEMDADGQHDPKEIPQFLKKIEQGADFVIGSRYIKGGSIPKEWGLDRKIQSVLGNIVIRLGFMKLDITDWTDGFRAIKSWIIKGAAEHIKPYNGYVFQIALLDFAVKNKAIVKEIPVQFQERTKVVSKISSGRYMVDILYYIFRYSSFVKFVIVGVLGFVVDFGFASIFIYVLHMNKVPANILSAELAIISNFLLNNFWSFKHKKIEGGTRSYFFNFAKFNILSLGSIVIQGVGLYLSLRFLGDHIIHFGALGIGTWILYKVVIILFIVIPYSYILYNRFIWKEK